MGPFVKQEALYGKFSPGSLGRIQFKGNTPLSELCFSYQTFNNPIQHPVAWLDLIPLSTSFRRNSETSVPWHMVNMCEYRDKVLPEGQIEAQERSTIKTKRKKTASWGVSNHHCIVNEAGDGKAQNSGWGLEISWVPAQRLRLHLEVSSGAEAQAQGKKKIMNTFWRSFPGPWKIVKSQSPRKPSCEGKHHSQL